MLNKVSFVDVVVKSSTPAALVETFCWNDDGFEHFAPPSFFLKHLEIVSSYFLSLFKYQKQPFPADFIVEGSFKK